MLSSEQNFQQRANQIFKNILSKDAKLSQNMKQFYLPILKQKPQQISSTKQCEVNVACEVENQEETFEFDIQIKSAEHMGSLSNQVYKVNMKNGTTIIIKHYLDILKEFVQRNFQHLVLNKMIQKKEYPYIFYKDNQCRIQQYVNGSSIKRQNLTPELLRKIVQKLAKFSLNYKDVILGYTESKSRQINNLFKTFREIYQLKRKQNPNLIAKVQGYVEGVLEQKKILQNLQKILKNETMILSHNDSNLSNILVLKKGESQEMNIQLLDYEFVNMNYVGYDLGNLLNQIATDYGGAYDSGEHSHQSKFQIRQDWQIEKSLVKQITNLYFDTIQSVGQQNFQKTTWERRERSVRIGRLLSHLYWLFIGVKQIDDPNIDLDMVYYVKRRYEQFMKLYQQMI